MLRICSRGILCRPNKEGLYYLKRTSSQSYPSSSPSAFLGTRSSFNTWHQRLGHPMMCTVHHVVSHNSLYLANKKEFFCSFCPLSKSHRLPFALSFTIYKAPLELVVCAIWGPSLVISNNQFRHYIHLLDVYSRFN